MEPSVNKTEKRIWIDFNTSAEQTPVMHANQVIVQTHDHEVFISFFNISPPLIFGTPEDQIRQSEAIESVRPDCVARINVTPRLLKEMIQVLQDNLEKYEAFLDSDDEATD